MSLILDEEKIKFLSEVIFRIIIIIFMRSSAESLVGNFTRVCTRWFYVIALPVPKWSSNVLIPFQINCLIYLYSLPNNDCHCDASASLIPESALLHLSRCVSATSVIPNYNILIILLVGISQLYMAFVTR